MAAPEAGRRFCRGLIENQSHPPGEFVPRACRANPDSSLTRARANDNRRPVNSEIFVAGRAADGAEIIGLVAKRIERRFKLQTREDLRVGLDDKAPVNAAEPEGSDPAFDEGGFDFSGRELFQPQERAGVSIGDRAPDRAARAGVGEGHREQFPFTADDDDMVVGVGEVIRRVPGRRPLLRIVKPADVYPGSGEPSRKGSCDVAHRATTSATLCIAQRGRYGAAQLTS